MKLQVVFSYMSTKSSGKSCFDLVNSKESWELDRKVFFALLLVLSAVTIVATNFDWFPFKIPHDVPRSLTYTKIKCDDQPAQETIASSDITSVVSGKRFQMKKQRDFGRSFKRTERHLEVSSNKCEKWAVFTTIFEASLSIKNFDSLYPEWCTVVVGDKISLEKSKFLSELQHTEYITLEEQEKLPFLSVPFTPVRSFARLNLGYLYAISQGAKVIFDVDDDNVVRKKHLEIPESFSTHISKTMNIYKYFIDDFSVVNMWPRGMPLDTINATYIETPKLQEIKRSDVALVQCLANKEPDVDSIHRLTSHHFYPFEFAKRPYSISVGLDMVVPTNAQATIFFQHTFWALFLPASVHGRVTDIWRAYITQSLYHRTGLYTIFRNCDVRHDRSAHDFMKDFGAEVPLFKRSGPLVDFLNALEPPARITATVIFERWKLMYEYGIIERSDVVFVEAYLNDLANLKIIEAR